MYDSASGGSWSSSNTAVATINSSGVLTGVSAGFDTITYTLTNVCGTTSATYAIKVNPLPVVNAITNQVVCNGSMAPAVTFSGSANTIYEWTNSDTSIGLAANGIGDIASFTAINHGSNPVTATITVTPVQAGGTGNAYVANAASNTVSVINTLTNQVTYTIANVYDGYGVAISPDGSKVYVTNSNSDDTTVQVISTATNTVIGTINVGLQPDGVVVSPGGNRIYVANTSSNTVSVIDATSNTAVATIPVGAGPLGIAISPNGSTVYVPNAFSGDVSVINTATNTVTATIAGLNAGGESGVAVSPNSAYVYVAGYNGSSISVIDASTNTVSATIPVQVNPSGIAVSPNGDYVYVTNNGSNTVSVISTLTNTVVANISVGTGPLGASISADGRTLYVANIVSGTVSVINTATNTLTNTITVGSAPYSLGNFISDNGCDGATVSFTITVGTQASSSASQTICSGSSYHFNNQNLMQSGVYIDTLHTVSGCDSIVTLSLTVDTVAVPTITYSGDTLQTQVYSSYQWLLNGAEIAGDTSRQIIATHSGSYTVVVSGAGGCTDTSSAQLIKLLGVEDILPDYTVKMYPNPTTGDITLSFSDNVVRLIDITDPLGRIVAATTSVAKEAHYSLATLSAGIYIVNIHEGEAMRSVKFSLVK